MPPLELSPHALRIADLPTKKPTRFSLRPDAPERAVIAKALGLRGLKKLSFEGEVAPKGRNDWRLTAKLGASVTQDCVVTLDPVHSRIDVAVVRDYVKDLDDPVGDEFEMPEDDSVEELGAYIDPWFVMQEALSIALPDYPRSQNAATEESQFTAPGVTAMTDEDAKPFAVLADMLKQNEKPENKG